MPVPFLAAAVLLAGGMACTIVRLPEAVTDGVDLPSDLPLVLRKGMRDMDIIARFGAPAERTRLGSISRMVYHEVYRHEHSQVELLGFAVNPAPTTRTRLHLVFQERALTQAWIEESTGGREPVTRWLVGGPEPGGG